MNQQNILKDVHLWLKTAKVPQMDHNQAQWTLAKNLILEELAELEEAVVGRDKRGQQDAIVDLIWVVLNWDYMNSVDAESFIKAVSDSNWSKFCQSESEAILTVEAYKNGTHPSKPGESIDCYFEESNGLWIVKRRDGKLMKSINFKDPV